MTLKELIDSLQTHLNKDPSLGDLEIYTDYFNTAVPVDGKPFTLTLVDTDSDDITTYSAYSCNTVRDFKARFDNQHPSIILGMYT